MITRRNIGSFVASTFALGLLAGCAQTVAVQRGPMAPATSAKAKVSPDKHGNTRISLKIEHLAPPSNLTPAKSVYIVWAQTREGRSFLLGQLALGKDLSAEFSGVAPVKQFRIVVSAEHSVSATEPSSEQVLFTDQIVVK